MPTTPKPFTEAAAYRMVLARHDSGALPAGVAAALSRLSAEDRPLGDPGLDTPAEDGDEAGPGL
jgi:hypothetical protein